MRVELQGFEDKYSADRDPWGFASDDYEQRKYATSVAALPSARYLRCFEPGCSIGALTDRLARIADEVVAWDASPTAVATARHRLADVANVDIECAAIPERWPGGRFDLIVFSEIGYYWDEAELAAIIERMKSSLDPGGHLLAVHWLGDSPDHILHGTTVHAVLTRVLAAPTVHHLDAGFILEIWEKR